MVGIAIELAATSLRIWRRVTLCSARMSKPPEIKTPAGNIAALHKGSARLVAL
jgi:hypothetical protein